MGVSLSLDASLDLTLAVIVFMGQPICVTGGGYKVFISNGFYAGHSYELDKFFIFAFLAVLHYNVMWISIQFVCRYAYLCLRERAADAKCVVRIVAALSAVWAFVGTYMCYTYSHPEPGFQEKGLYALRLNKWDIAGHIPVVVGSHNSEWRLPAWIAMWSVSCVGGAIVVAVSETKIRRHFASIGNVSHNNTRRMHKDFHRALLAMAICPLFSTAVPIMYFLVAAYMEWSHGFSQAFLTMAGSSITMFNPLTTICFMRAYRKAVLKPFLKKRVTTACDTRVTGLSIATSSVNPEPSTFASATSN
ncbi:hypothetical protein AAVH_23701 [Aphelenchoides avenae]|nr:hypothetical protein AAVH_23699 [Aphelenchus avenae]KAH7709034.1 hypothetical protein AAVH_23701 [Aphelenchus avenae]